MVKLIARLRAKSGKAEELTAALLELAGPSRAEVPCFLYDVCRSVSDPNELFVLEEWESQDALDAHMATPHFRAFAERIADMVDGELGVTMLERL